MARWKFGQGRNKGQICSGLLFRPVVCLVAMLPLLAACDSLLDVAGLERKSAHESASSQPVQNDDGAHAPEPRKKMRTDLAGSTKVEAIQAMLNELGYDAGPNDGIIGPRTEAAIQKFQVDANMAVDGRISAELSAALQGEYEFRNGTAKTGARDSIAQRKIGLLAGPDDDSDLSEEDESGGAYNKAAELTETPMAIDGENSAAGTVASTTGAQAKPERKPVYSISDEPYYEIGDNYIYSNGRIETAVRIKGPLVHWVVNDGSRYTAVSNFVMPPVKLENRTGSVESTVASSSSVKWPPANTDEVRFVANPSEPGADRHLYEAWSGEWVCGVEGESTIAVPAGKFDVVKIGCEKTSRAPGEWRRRVWYYAPDIRHFVRKEEAADVGQMPKAMELIGIRPGRNNWTRSARSGFKWAIQKLLDGGSIGDSIEWAVADSGIQFDITLTGEMETAGSIICRRYTVVRKMPGQPRMFPALACRDGISGQWKIPGLEKGSVLPADVLALR